MSLFVDSILEPTVPADVTDGVSILRHDRERLFVIRIGKLVEYLDPLPRRTTANGWLVACLTDDTDRVLLWLSDGRDELLQVNDVLLRP